ncbi:PorP/SprF family type IX secretion system membrane protein [Pedobacter africanus]|uniref:Type IX secretion system membrane protein, PorP/SprF family n=1 Tax=Pedobacter africanus TaxID=151894 RepID=A0A1W2BC85_9SPHI|nr:type IX secretion system membrane protein PorP/SprF [Pedobacter africanus]SMC70516.1 type IX secretion system membrane protein, PorP/SprF family [Pedobacter africanus]
MKKLILSITGLIFFLVQSVSAQQDAQFSQYMFNGIYINPAYAGYREQLNVHAFYRSQWTGIDGAPKTMSLAVDAIANDGNVGLAFQVSNDKLGAQTNLSAYASYAYRLRMNADGTSRLAFGVSGGLVQLGIDGSLLNPNDPEPFQSAGLQSTVVPDARAGVYYSNDRFYAGFSVDNLLSQYIDVKKHAFIPQPKPHFYLTAGMLLPFSADVLLKPSFLLKDDRGGPTSLDVSAFLILAERLWIGGAYRTGVKLYDKSYIQQGLSNLNSAVAAVQIFPTSNLRIGYAYDFSMGAMRGYSNGTHELSIGYFFNRKKVRMLSPRYF